MPGPGEAAFDAYLPADLVLGQADIGVIVADRLGNLLYVNGFSGFPVTWPGWPAAR